MTDRDCLRKLVDAAKQHIKSMKCAMANPYPSVVVDYAELDDITTAAESLLSQPEGWCPGCAGEGCYMCGQPERDFEKETGTEYLSRVMQWRDERKRERAKRAAQPDPVRAALEAVVEARDASDEHYRGCDCERCQVLDEILDEIDRQLSKLGGEDKKPKEGVRR